MGQYVRKVEGAFVHRRSVLASEAVVATAAQRATLGEDGLGGENKLAQTRGIRDWLIYLWGLLNGGSAENKTCRITLVKWDKASASGQSRGWISLEATVTFGARAFTSHPIDGATIKNANGTAGTLYEIDTINITHNACNASVVGPDGSDKGSAILCDLLEAEDVYLYISDDGGGASFASGLNRVDAALQPLPPG